MFLQKTYGQVPIGVFNESERGYFQTLKALADYLKLEKTPVIPFHDTGFYTKDEAFYDTVINTFFEKELMGQEFGKDTSVHSVKKKLDAVRHILNKCDHGLDTLYPASILIVPGRSLLNSGNPDEGLHNALNVLIQVGDKKVFMFTMFFDKMTNKISGISAAEHESELQE